MFLAFLPMWPKAVHLLNGTEYCSSPCLLQIYAPHNALDVENGSQRGSILARLSAERSHPAQRTGGAPRSAARSPRPAAAPVAAAQEPIGRLLIPKYLCSLRDAPPKTYVNLVSQWSSSFNLKVKKSLLENLKGIEAFNSVVHCSVLLIQTASIVGLAALINHEHHLKRNL